jgi:pimeloyl-ACP methyl ester carboxylesterase
VRVSLGLDKKGLDGREPEEWQALLSVEHDRGAWAPRRTSLLAKTDISPGSVVRTPYDRLPKPNDFFPYDWRLDCRYNALRLADHLRAYRPTNGRWNLIGHSQGGLLIVLASTLMKDVHEFGKLVRRVVLVGCPLAGTQRAVEAVTTGRADFGADASRIATARGLAQNWPALYQMLPAWPSVLGPKGRPLEASKQFNSIRGYPAVFAKGLDEGLMRRARETQALLARPLSRFGPDVETLIIQGEKQDTPTFATRTGSVLSATGKEIAGRPEILFGMTRGDTLVPSEVTIDHVGEEVAERVLRLSGKVKAHAFMCDGTFVVKKIWRFLATAIVLASLAAPSAAVGQQYRFQVGGSGALSEGWVLIGRDAAVDIGGGECVKGEVPCTVPEWTFLAGGYVGGVTERSPATAYGHVGLERKLSGDFGVGLLGFLFAHPFHWGTAGRFDALDVGAIKLGYGWGDRPGFLVAIEVASNFLIDLRR